MDRPSWHYRQSAVLAWRRRQGRLEVLLVTSRKGKRWVLPKGIVEPGMSPWASAAKEAEVEAGVVGRVGEREIGRYRYEKWGGVCAVEVFLLEVEEELETWPENFRRRQWLSPEDAAERVREPELRGILRQANACIEADG